MVRKIIADYCGEKMAKKSTKTIRLEKIGLRLVRVAYEQNTKSPDWVFQVLDQNVQGESFWRDIPNETETKEEYSRILRSVGYCCIEYLIKKNYKNKQIPEWIKNRVSKTKNTGKNQRYKKITRAKRATKKDGKNGHQ